MYTVSGAKGSGANVCSGTVAGKKSGRGVGSEEGEEDGAARGWVEGRAEGGEGFAELVFDGAEGDSEVVGYFSIGHSVAFAHQENLPAAFRQSVNCYPDPGVGLRVINRLRVRHLYLVDIDSLADAPEVIDAAVSDYPVHPGFKVEDFVCYGELFPCPCKRILNDVFSDINIADKPKGVHTQRQV